MSSIVSLVCFCLCFCVGCCRFVYDFFWLWLFIVCVRLLCALLSWRSTRSPYLFPLLPDVGMLFCLLLLWLLLLVCEVDVCVVSIVFSISIHYRVFVCSLVSRLFGRCAWRSWSFFCIVTATPVIATLSLLDPLPFLPPRIWYYSRISSAVFCFCCLP